jgi:hypothetical protein
VIECWELSTCSSCSTTYSQKAWALPLKNQWQSVASVGAAGVAVQHVADRLAVLQGCESFEDGQVGRRDAR